MRTPDHLTEVIEAARTELSDLEPWEVSLVALLELGDDGYSTVAEWELGGAG
jgi:hypothetical protein